MKTVLISKLDKKNPADLWISGHFEKNDLKRLLSIEPSFAKIASGGIQRKRFEGKFGQTFSSYHQDFQNAPELVLFGLGEEKNFKKISLRKAAGQIIQMAKARKIKRVRVQVESFIGGEVLLSDAVAIFSEVALLATYEFDKYKTKKPEPDAKVETLELSLTERKYEQSLKGMIEYSKAVAEGVNFARTLINEPGNILNPQTLVQAARKMAIEKKIRCEILQEPALKRLKMGGILGVNQGSVTPAALIVLEYGKKFAKKGTVCLVGKGVTFDTGGISIKPAKDMEKMKYDMSGAATVIATLGVVADLALPVHVIALAPTVENMVAENPQRPGDIITMFNGKTVEVLNTDAEGRLILADALSYSKKYRPAAIIDLATLTGMCAYTFGDKAIGLLGTDDDLIDKVKKAGQSVGERCWQLPLWDEYGDQIKGHHSDLYNIGGPYGGTITAAMFLKEFVPEKTPWVHLDIAGTAWADSPRYDCPKGATGVGVRLLTELLANWK